jgi:hypothetical protein
VFVEFHSTNTPTFHSLVERKYEDTIVLITSPPCAMKIEQVMYNDAQVIGPS